MSFRLTETDCETLECIADHRISDRVSFTPPIFPVPLPTARNPAGLCGSCHASSFC